MTLLATILIALGEIIGVLVLLGMIVVLTQPCGDADEHMDTMK